MAEKRTKRDPLEGERTRCLAAVVLTRRDDLKVTGASRANTGLDLFVDIRNPDSPGLRRFAAVVYGDESPATEKRLAQVLKAALREVPHLEQIAFPVCLLYFIMEGEKGYFTWLVEPVLTEEGAPKLCPPADPALVPLDEKVLAGVVQQVRSWYRALFAALKV
jgi:hypothetical protein